MRCKLCCVWAWPFIVVWLYLRTESIFFFTDLGRTHIICHPRAPTSHLFPVAFSSPSLRYEWIGLWHLESPVLPRKSTFDLGRRKQNPPNFLQLYCRNQDAVNRFGTSIKILLCVVMNYFSYSNGNSVKNVIVTLMEFEVNQGTSRCVCEGISREA